MVAQLELILLGFAVVVDSVLLLALLERVNRPNTAIWITTLVAFTWLAHASGFSHVLIRGANAEPLVMLDRFNLALIAVSLLAIPSAMLHAAVRLNHSLHNLRPHWDWRYAFAYVPCLLAPLVIYQAFTSAGRVLGACFEPFLEAYLWSMLSMNIVSSAMFLRYRKFIELASTRRFFLQLAGLLVGMSSLVACYGWFARDTAWDLPIRLLVILSPLSVILLFLWYALRDKLLPLVFERALVYGGSLVLVMLFHRVLVIPFAESMRRKSSLDVILVEGIFLVGIILAWPPLRNRVRESLRYLLSRNIFQVREAMRQLSLQISQQDSRSLNDLCDWFTRSSCELLCVEEVWIWFSDVRVDTPRSWKFGSEEHCKPAISEVEMHRLHELLLNRNENNLGRANLRDRPLNELCERLNVQHVFRCQFRDLHGLVLLGPRIRSDRFSEEQRASLSLLFDQFTATLFNRMVEQDRLRAERQAAQQEKLAVLGLMSGSLAHEIRNPLSSIRTIASLLREDLAAQPVQANDVAIILHEIDRLTGITQRLLDYSKPADDRVIGIDPHCVIERLFHILEPWAAQQQVKLLSKLSSETSLVRATDASLSEILFNLLRNAIEATRTAPNACVIITTKVCDSMLNVQVIDNGPGIDPAIRDNIYRPFVTSKEFGTGLGLYIAAERVRSINGTIECTSTLETGTVFELHLPLVNDSMREPKT
jgi:signal transduction histidine kinase